MWGVIAAASALEETLPADTEARLASFTELVAMAVENAESRADLAASRADAQPGDLGPGLAGPDAKPEPAAGEHVQARAGLGQHLGRPQRRVSDVGHEPQAAGLALAPGWPGCWRS
jgi:hypothetical protein